MDATKFLQTLMDGTAVGSIYALIALGYTMVYGILKFINFAHSDIFVLGAWISLAIATVIGWKSDPHLEPPGWILTLLVLLAAVTILAVLYERVLPRLAPGLSGRLPRTALTGSLLVVVAGIGLTSTLIFAAYWLRKLSVSSNLPESLAWLKKGIIDPAPGFVILLAAMVIVGTIGFLVERLAYRPLRSAPRLNVLITALGVSLFLQTFGQLKWRGGTQPQRMPSLLKDVVLVTVQRVDVHLVDVIGAGTAVLLMFALELLVFHTKIGRAMRAVSYDTKIASLMGVPVDAVISFTFVLGSSLAAAAGFLYAMKYPGLNQPAHMTWILLGLKAFVAAVIGGIGNIRGAMLGGFLIGLLEMFGAAYVSPNLRDVYVFSLLIVVLLVKPTGILGRSVAEKV